MVTYIKYGSSDLQYVHEKRGTEAMNEIDLLPKFKGIAVHDCLASYFVYEKCEHAVCNAHLLRDLKAVYEQTEPNMDTGYDRDSPFS